MKQLLLLSFFLVSFSGFAELTPVTNYLELIPNCPEITDKNWWLELAKKMEASGKDNNMHVVNRINRNRRKFIPSSLCDEIKNIFEGEVPRVKALTNAKVLLLSDKVPQYQIQLDVMGQYYRIIGVSKSRGAKQFLDLNLNTRGRRKFYEFQDISHFDYSWEAKQVLIDKQFISKLSPEEKFQLDKRKTQVYCNRSLK
ncbi:MAG: hypothetical protein JNM93_06900 [Bacteriovoracaceae bacterium]|nr:hypothetical protein [Bacteriovoracaceae bacterium]